MKTPFYQCANKTCSPLKVRFLRLNGLGSNKDDLICQGRHLKKRNKYIAERSRRQSTSFKEPYLFIAYLEKVLNSGI